MGVAVCAVRELLITIVGFSTGTVWVILLLDVADCSIMEVMAGGQCRVTISVLFIGAVVWVILLVNVVDGSIMEVRAGRKCGRTGSVVFVGAVASRASGAF